MQKASDKFIAEKNQLDNVINAHKTKVEDLNNKLAALTHDNDELNLENQKKAREIEGLRLKINAMQDRDKEIGTWKQRHQDLQKSHSQILEDVKNQTHTSLKNKSV